MFRINVRVCAVFLFASCVLPLAAQRPTAASANVALPPAVVLYGCVNNTSGAIRIVSQSTVCKSTEHKIQWNQVGPQGSQGPQGPQGPAGISVGLSATLPPGSDVPLLQTPGSVILQTNSVPTSGVYYINASALLEVASADPEGAFCYDAVASIGTASQYGGSGDAADRLQQASIADMLFVSAGDSIQLWCESALGAGSYVFNAGITATLISSTSDAPKRAGRSHARPTSAKKPK